MKGGERGTNRETGRGEQRGRERQERGKVDDRYIEDKARGLMERA